MNGRHLVQQVAGVYDRLRPPPSGVVVLIYHRVGGGTTSAVDLPVDVFREQMTVLARTCTVLSLDDAVDQLAAGGAPEGVVLTFDDGTPDFYECAVPVLESLQLPATLYAATGPIDRGEPMPWGVPSASWSSLRAAVATGLVTIASHTRDHSLLDRLDRLSVAEDLDASLASITEQIGRAPRHFAYPRAVPGNPAAEVEVRTRFASAALAGNRVNVAGCDLHRLARTPVHRADPPDVFVRKIHGGLRLEGSVREVVAKVRAQRS